MGVPIKPEKKYDNKFGVYFDYSKIIPNIINNLHYKIVAKNNDNLKDEVFNIKEKYSDNDLKDSVTQVSLKDDIEASDTCSVSLKESLNGIDINTEDSIERLNPFIINSSSNVNVCKMKSCYCYCPICADLYNIIIFEELYIGNSLSG